MDGYNNNQLNVPASIALGLFAIALVYIMYSTAPESFLGSEKSKKASRYYAISTIFSQLPDEQTKASTVQNETGDSKFYYKQRVDSIWKLPENFQHFNQMIQSGNSILKHSQDDLVSFEKKQLEIEWQYNLKNKEQKWISPPIAINQLIYAVSDDNIVHVISRANGQLMGLFRFNPKLKIISLHSLHDKIFLLSESKKNANKLDLSYITTNHSFQINWTTTIGGKQDYTLGFTVNDEHLIVSAKDFLAALNMKGEIIWKKQMTTPFAVPVTIQGETIYYALESKLAGAYNADNGKEFWTAELKETPQSPFVYIPSYNFLAISLEQDYLQVLKATNGESMFKFNTYNEGEPAHLLPLQVSAPSIKRLELPWRYEGYVLSTVCAKVRVCLLDPFNGRILSRIYTNVDRLISPIQIDDGQLSIWATEKDSKNEVLIRFKKRDEPTDSSVNAQQEKRSFISYLFDAAIGN